MRRVMEGAHAVSWAVRLARVEVIGAYPITPATHVAELLAEMVADGTLDAQYIQVESEHSAMAAVIGASATGARSFTATSSQGLVLMHEVLHWAAGSRLPIVMANVNRALGPGWNIWADQTDSLAQRDTGWMQVYCEDVQEVVDTTLMAFKLAERVRLPMMVNLDAFFLSHTYEPVDLPEQAAVDAFLPPREPEDVLDPTDPPGVQPVVCPGCVHRVPPQDAAGHGAVTGGVRGDRPRVRRALRALLRCLRTRADAAGGAGAPGLGDHRHRHQHRPRHTGASGCCRHPL